MSGHMRVALTFVLAMVTIGVTSAGLKQRPSPQVGLYAADPNHLWNRIHRHFHVRVTADGHGYGSDTVDPLLWRETRYLLEGPSHQRAVGLLDEFLASHGETLITDPVKRVVLQRDLWAIFDWLANESEILPERRRVLMPRLARAIRRLALNRSQIDRLPDVYRLAADSHVLADRLDAARPERPFLPPDFFASSGPWVTIGGSYPIAPQHVLELSRSAFLVLWNLPGGSSATKAYLSKLWDFPEPYVVDGSFTITRDGERRMKVNPALPALPMEPRSRSSGRSWRSTTPAGSADQDHGKRATPYIRQARRVSRVQDESCRSVCGPGSQPHGSRTRRSRFHHVLGARDGSVRVPGGARPRAAGQGPRRMPELSSIRIRAWHPVRAKRAPVAAADGVG